MRLAKTRVASRVVEVSDTAPGRLVGRRVDTLHRLFQNDSSNTNVNGERWLLDRLADLQPRTYLDVGANEGAWTAHAMATSASVSVHAFEPVPSTFEHLRRRFADDPRVQLNAVALTSDGVAELPVWTDESRGAAMSSAVAPPAAGSRRVDVPAMSGDDYVRAAGIESIDLVKIDVEGHEMEVLDGFSDTLASGHVDVVQFEFTLWAAIGKRWLADYAEVFVSHGFEIGKLFPRHVEWKPYEASDEQFYRCNFVAARPGTASFALLS